MTHAAIGEVHQNYPKTVLGFWIYLMTDCILFTVLFTTYLVFHDSTFGGPTSHELFDLNYALVETMILLISSFTCGLAVLAFQKLHKPMVYVGLFITFLLGISFLVMELNEFTNLVQEGNGWQRSAFLSSYFTLVGTHGTHITFGLLWLVILVGQIICKGMTSSTFRRLTCFSLFWHFLDLVWIFIFTIVYLMGVAK